MAGLRYFVGYGLLLVALLAGGLILDAQGVEIGQWIAVAVLLAVVMLSLPDLPDREDVLPLLAIGAALAAGLVGRDLVGAPSWLDWVVIAVVSWAAWRFVSRREDERTGQIRIPEGYRFGQRRRD